MVQVDHLELLINLKTELNEAIQKEDYEYAAQLRNEIRLTEKQGLGNTT